MWVDVGIIEIWGLLHLGHIGFGVASVLALPLLVELWG